MKVGWKKITLGESAPAFSFEVPIQEEVVWNLSLEDIQPHTGKVQCYNLCKASDLGPSKCAFGNEHVLYSKLRPYLNKVVVPDRNGVGTSELIPLMPNPRVLDREYFAYYLRSPGFLEFSAVNTRGANLPRISMEALWGHEFYVPAVVEQRLIVARIKECMERVEEMERLREETLADSKSALRAFYSELYQTLLASNSTKQLKDCGVIRGGGTPSKQNEVFWKGEIPWVSPKEMKVRELHSTSLTISEAALAGSSVKLIENPSVLFVVRGMILAHTLPVAVNKVPVTVNQDMKAVSPSSEFDVDFLAAMLRGAERLLLKKIEIAGHGTCRLKTEDWASLPIPIMPLEKQSDIVQKVREVERIMDSVNENVSTDEISSIRDAILRKAFAGEL
jgi:type I restriction enzyme S subunit